VIYCEESIALGYQKKGWIATYPKVRYPLRTPYRDTTTGDQRSHAIFEPLNFIARLAALVPKPRVNLSRSHAVFVGRLSRGGPPPDSRHRVTITPAKRNKTKQALPLGQEKTRVQKHQSMTWAQRLKRVFNIDIETCEQCGGAVKVIASIDKSAGKPICTANAVRRFRHKDVSDVHPLVLQKILSHLNTKNDEVVEFFPHKVERLLR
jgi:hypothetical protein